MRGQCSREVLLGLIGIIGSLLTAEVRLNANDAYSYLFRGIASMARRDYD